MPTDQQAEFQKLVALSREIRTENGEREQKLCAKCRWEHMTRTAVLKSYGDPKNW